MIAALPMYDRPELRDHTDALWACICDALGGMGITAPPVLTRDRDPWDIWQSPDLVLAQTCGLPFRARLQGKVQLVATPDYGLPGCAAGYYRSVIIARDARLPDRPRVAINDPLSQSGWAALHDWARGRDLPLGPVSLTQSHAASVRAVAEDLADIAAIDAQTWRQLIRFAGADPALEIARTPPTPGLPLITGMGQDPARIRSALAIALADVPAPSRRALDLNGFVHIRTETYLSPPIPPNP